MLSKQCVMFILSKNYVICRPATIDRISPKKVKYENNFISIVIG